MTPKRLGFLSGSKCMYVSPRPTTVINMAENRTKRKLNSNVDMLDWMLAIDFDSVEVRHARHDVFQKYVQVLDKSAFTVKKGD